MLSSSDFPTGTVQGQTWAGRADSPCRGCKDVPVLRPHGTGLWQSGEGAFPPWAAHGADQSPGVPACVRGGSPVPPSTAFVRSPPRESVGRSRGTRHPESHGGEQPRSLPRLFPQGDPAQTPCPKTGSCLSSLLPAWPQAPPSARGGTACTHGCPYRSPLGPHPSRPTRSRASSPRISHRSIPRVGWQDGAYLRPGVPRGGTGAGRPAAAAAAAWKCHLGHPWCPPGGPERRLGLRVRHSLHQRLLPGEGCCYYYI